MGDQVGIKDYLGITVQGKILVEKILGNHTDKSYWQGKFGEYDKVNKFTEYNFDISGNVENLGKSL